MRQLLDFDLEKRFIEYLSKQEELHTDTEALWRVKNFQMPSIKEVLKAVNAKKGNMYEYEERDIEHAQFYLRAPVLHAQRRLLRYSGMYIAMAGLIDWTKYYFIEADLREVDVDLMDPRSVEDGRKRIAKSFTYVMGRFNAYAERALDMSSYEKGDRIFYNLERLGYSDEERFGSEILCINDWLLYIDEYDNEMYVQPSARRIAEMKKEFEVKTAKNEKIFASKVEEALSGLRK